MGGIQERDPLPDQMFDHPTRDVALMKLRTPFVIGGQSSGWTRAISVEPNVPTLVSNNPHARCFGYGRTGTFLDSREFLLGQDIPSPGHLTPDPLLFVAYWGGSSTGVIQQGDSGGPCLTLLPGPSGKPEVLGIDREGYGGGLNISRYESAPGFRDLFTAIMEADYAVQGDIDADGKGDTLLVNCVNSSYHLELRWGAGGPPVDVTWLVPSFLLPCGTPQPSTPKPFATRGNFNSDKSSASDPFDDFLVVLQGRPLYFDGSVAGLVAHPFDFGGALYHSFSTSDVDGDGYDDAEGVDVNGKRYVFYGSPEGLQPGRQVWGFPTPDGDDGKLLTVTGPGNATLQYKSATLWVSFPSTTPDISIEVFDGDVGGFNDRLEPASACYTLTSDKWADGMGTDVVVELPDSEFRDNAWTALYRGPLPKTGSACITGGDCWYRIDVELGSEGACSSQPVSSALNAFKVRATGIIGYALEEWSVIARDAANDDYAQRQTAGLFVPDTTYDGFFDFTISVGQETVGKTLRLDDDDADYLGDADSPGLAVGASDLWYMFWPWSWSDQNQVAYNLDPSGNFPDREHWDVVPPVADNYYWTLNEVYAENNIHVWTPYDAASHAPLAVFGTPAPNPGQLPKKTSAVPLGVWSSEVVEITPFLPLQIGVGGAAFLVTSESTALTLLRAGLTPAHDPASAAEKAEPAQGNSVTICHRPPGNHSKVKAITVSQNALPAHLAHGDDLRPPRVRAQLLAELLTLKLNVARAASLGEDLSSALRYGTISSVSQAIETADEAVPSLEEACALPTSRLDAMERASAVLRSVNEGWVYRFPRRPASGQLEMSRPSFSVSAQSGTPVVWGWPYWGL